MILSGKGWELKFDSFAKNITVSITASFERKDLGGQSSSTAVSSAGNKPKKISVGMLVPVEKARFLAKLLQMAEAVGSDKNPVAYTIADSLCSAVQIRQVIFCGDVRTKKSDSLQCYDVSFSLQEFKSVAEKKEERENEKTTREAPKTNGTEKISSVNPSKVNEAIKKVNNQ
jgi:hypothetical protein